MDAPTGILRAFDDLIAAVVGQGLPHEVDRAAQRVVLPVRRPPVVGTIAMTWAAAALQLVHVLDGVDGAVRFSALADAIARINHALPEPGFGLDGGVVYFRLALLRRRGTDDLAAAAIGPALTTVIDTVAAFGPALRAVAAGARAPDQVLRAGPPGAPSDAGAAEAFDWMAE
jgi:hypothetical protein